MSAFGRNIGWNQLDESQKLFSHTINGRLISFIGNGNTACHLSRLKNLNQKSKHIVFFLLAALVLVLTGCSTQKNTAGTRFYHAMTARFNIYYNGEQAFLEGIAAQEKFHEDDYGNFIPIFLPKNKQTSNNGKSSFDAAITKCEKAIKLHSITKRPKMNANKRRTEKDKAFLARKEFNPFLKNAWMLMGQSQFQKGEFIEAASTFNYIIQLYETQPEIVCVARAWLARCYVQLEWPYDAEDVFDKISRDSLTAKGLKERDASYADYLIMTGAYAEAIPYLERTVQNVRNRKQKARLNYLLGQLYRETGNSAMAYKSLKKVIRSNPPYELELSARVLQSEVVPPTQYKQTVKGLLRMAKSSKNKDYLDQIYFALGNVHLYAGDTLKCIGAYEEGVEKSTRNGNAKALVLLHLCELYWEREEYIDANRCYAQLMGLLKKEHEAYQEAEHRSKILAELSPHLEAVELQDSLQELVSMSEAERNAVIDRIIEELKKKEKEEAIKAYQENNTANQAGATTSVAKPVTPTAPNMGQNNAKWYFYNPMVVQQGKAQFQKIWGNRKLEDNWRRSDKETVNTHEFEEINYDEEIPDDSVSMDKSEVTENQPTQEEVVNDSLADDPHERAYYLKQLPFTEEQLAASNAALSEGLYQAAIIEMEQLNNYPLAHRTFLRLLTDFPEYGQMEMAYYYMFLLYRRMGNPEEAEVYRQKLIDAYPEGEFAQKLANPNYERYARYGKQIEDSLYAETYRLYQQDQYEQVIQNQEYALREFPEGAHRARFLFLRALSELYTDRREDFLKSLKELVQNYPKEEVTEIASYIVKETGAGRMLNREKYDASSIWERRSMLASDDSTALQTMTLSPERYCNFAFVIAYPEFSLNENKLLFELARYNFSSYLVRNFDIEIENRDGLVLMMVKGFLSYDEVHAYVQKLAVDPTMKQLLKDTRTLLISEENLKLLGTRFSVEDYQEFYDKTFAPLQIKEDLMLDEPTEIRYELEEDSESGDQQTDDKYDEDEYGFDYW